MDNNVFKHKLEILTAKSQTIRNEINATVKSYLEANQNTEFTTVLKFIGKVSKIQAIKLHYDYLGGTLIKSKQAVDKLLLEN